MGDGTIEPLIEVGPRAAEIDKAAAVGAEDEIAAFVALTRLEDRERLQHERDVVRPSVFGSLARQANERRLWINFAPAQAGNFLAPRTGQHQQPQEWRIVAAVVERVPDRREFVIR